MSLLHANRGFAIAALALLVLVLCWSMVDAKELSVDPNDQPQAVVVEAEDAVPAG